MITVNDASFKEEVLDAEGLVVIDFGATWCGPCKKIEPIMDELSGVYDGKVKIRKVDVGEAPGVAQQYRVLSVPQLLFFKEGNVVEQIVGLVSRDRIIESLEKHM